MDLCLAIIPIRYASQFKNNMTFPVIMQQMINLEQALSVEEE